jgi:hypothetical protein
MSQCTPTTTIKKKDKNFEKKVDLQKTIDKRRKKRLISLASNPSYSADRDKEDHSSKPAQSNSLKDPKQRKKKKRERKKEKGKREREREREREKETLS